jgi:hypothetical protein
MVSSSILNRNSRRKEGKLTQMPIYVGFKLCGVSYLIKCLGGTEDMLALYLPAPGRNVVK